MAPSRRTPDRRPRAAGRGTPAPSAARPPGGRSGAKRPTPSCTTPRSGTSATRPGGTSPAPEPRAAAEGGRPSGRVAIVALILLVLVISYASSLRAWLQQRDDVAAARAELAQTQTSIEDLERTKLRWEDPAFIEQQARLRLGWVLPGEVGYRVIGADGEPLGDSVLEPEELAAQAAPEDWYASLWGSIEAAGADPEADAAAEQTAPDPDAILRPSREREQDGS